MKAPSLKGGGTLIKGEPSKPVKTTIDKTKYQSVLDQPIVGTGTNVVGASQADFTPAVLKNMGYNYVSGTLGGKDIVYEKGGKYHIYNEQPNAKENKYGLIDIGNPNEPIDVSKTALGSLTTNKTTPAVNPNHKALNLSNPNLTYDPNTGQYYNPITGKGVEPIVESYSKGGKVKGYDEGGTIPSDQISPVQPQKPAKNGQLKGALGTALGGYGTTYYASNPGETKQENARSAVLGAVGQTGAIGGVISGVAGIGDKIGAPIKARAEATDENGNIIDPKKAKNMALLGGLLSPSKALTTRSSYKGGWTDLNGDAYLHSIENEKKAEIEAQRQEELKRLAVINQGRINNAVTLRDANNLTQDGYKDGGPIKGPGTAKSDSIKAKIKPNSFVVPEENKEIAKAIRKTVLKAPSAKANLNQKGGQRVNLSNGEELFTPKEVEKIENKLGDGALDVLAPNSASNEDKLEGEKTEGLKNGGTPKQRKQYLSEKIANKSATPQEMAEYGRLMSTDRPSKTVKAPKVKQSQKQAETSNGLTVAEMMKLRPGLDNSTEKPLVVPKTNLANAGQTIEPNQSIRQSGNESASSQDAVPSERKGMSFDLGKALNYGLPLVQTGLGLKALKDAGKRPVDELDPDYLASIAKAKSNALLAGENAKYGYTPEEMAMLRNQNANLTAGQRYNARALSGGSSSAALNNERVALNDAYGRDLQLAANNKALQLQKQDIAYGRQGYVDDLTGVNKEAKRRLFNDKMNGWQQNQMSGRELLGAGINNLVSAQRYNDELAAMDKRNTLYNSNLY